MRKLLTYILNGTSENVDENINKTCRLQIHRQFIEFLSSTLHTTMVKIEHAFD